jgi:uncharacterized protein YggE
MNESSAAKNPNKLNLSLDYRLVVVALLAIIVAMLLVWKPWASAKTTDRTIAVTGQATVTAKPDQYTFYPTYQFTNASKQAAIDALSAKNNEIVAKLKALGVPDSKIKNNASGWAYPVYNNGADSAPTYSLQITVIANTDALAQKVEDYLLTTSPTGAVSPQATFSDQKRKALEDQGRDAAAKDARAKAEQSGKNLGFKVAAVKTVNDGTGFNGGIYPMGITDSAKSAAGAPSLTIQPGENDLNYSVTVTYFIK